MNYGTYYYITRNYPEAIRIYKNDLENRQADPSTLMLLGIVYGLNKDYAQAIAACEKSTRLDDSPMYLVEAGIAYAIAGQKDNARKVLAELQQKNRYVCPFEIALIYVQLGETDTAFGWLQKAIQGRSLCMVWLRDPRLDPIRSDPRFVKILQELKFP